MKTKRILSALLSLAMVLTMFTVLTLTAPMTASAATTTEKAIFIGSTTKTITAAFIPLNITPESTTWYKLSFKCKMLQNGRSTAQAGKPSIGIVGQAASDASPAYKVGTCPSWAGAYATEGTDCDDYNYNADLTSGVYSMYFKLDGGSWNKSADKYSQGNRSFYLTVGNAAYRNFSSHVAFDNMGCSFIFSDVSLYQAASQGGATSGDNLIPQINDSNVDFGGTYYLLGDGNSDSTVADSLLAASANKWHVVAMPDHVKYVTVPSDYNTSSNYNAANFSQTAETTYTREYYTNTNYTDLTFAKLANSGNAGYQVISDINKKMIVIDANHEGEADNRTTDGYKPVYNRPANIFIPLSLGQYNISKYGKTTDTSYLARISMKAVRLEGDGYPVLGRITPRDTDHSQALAKMAKNLHLSGYYSAGSHEQYTGGDYSYNETTGEFVGWIRVKGGDSTYRTKYGTSEIITIGNAEHVWADGTFDTTEFNSSFAISDIKVDLYSYTGSYTVDSLLYEDVALPLYAETIDTDTQWIYQCNGQSYSAHSRDVARASQTTWNAEGCVGMVHTKNLTACMRSNHSLTHHAATSTTREYYSCASCSKNFADPWGLEQVTDLTSTQQMALIAASGTGSESVFYPVKLNGFENNQWFKFTCKVKCFGDSYPVVSSLYANYDGKNQCETTVSSSNDGDFAFWESSYDPSTGILTGYMKAWIKNTINQGSRYSYERINPISGANCAIVIGNGRYVGTGYADDSHTTGFAITEPTLYKVSGATTGGSSGLADAKTKSTTGDNLLKPITDKTVDFSSDYVATWSNANNPLSAPVGKWYKTGSKKNWVSASNIPTGFYEGTTTPKLLEINGLKSNSNSRYFVQKQLFLDSEKTYQFDADYRTFGGYGPYISTVYHTGGSWTDLSRTNVTDTGSHISFRFTTPEGLRSSGDGNFMLRLGLPYDAQRSSIAYYTNVKVTSVSTGNNSMIYGDFAFSDNGTLTSDNAGTILPGWENTANFVAGYDKIDIRALPEDDLFSGTALSGKSDIALKVPGGDYTELQYKIRLKAGTYYKLSYDYRNIEDAPTFTIRNGDNITATQVSSTSGGKYRMTYQLYNSGSDNPNTRICFSFGAKSNSKTFYIGNVQVYELTGNNGSTVGANIMGHLNPILNNSSYSALSSVGSSVNLTLNQDDSTNISRELAKGWFIGNSANSFTDDAQLVKVTNDFFTYKTPAQRQELIRKVALGRASANNYDPTYDPNNDGTRSDVKDLVHSKIASVFSSGETQNVTDSMVEEMFESTIMNPDDSSAYGSGGTKYYVSSSGGNDSNAGTSEGASLKTIAKANSKASSGDTIYLKRGDTWYTPDATADASFTLKSGVHYAAYGSGAKPLLSGSLKNYGGSSNSSGWTQASTNIWQYTYYSGSATTNANAGMIYFIDADGTVHPGKDIAAPDTANNVYTYSAADLDSDLEYFAPYKSGSNTITAGSYSSFGKIYVYSTTNPATRFPNIQIALTHHVVEANNGTGSSESAVTSMTNIAVMYGASHGVKSISGGQNFWINKCEIAYIGGAPQFISAGSNRLGNGVEFGNGYTNGRVYDSYVHDCFDAGLTFQSYKSGLNSAVSFSNIYFCRNVIENCTYNIEFFLNRNDSDSMSNIYIEDNILRNAGYGWGCYDRADGGFRTGNIAASKNSYINNVSSTYIRNNIFDCTRLAHVMWTWSSSPDRHAGLTATGNTYIQRKGAMDWSVMAYGPIGGAFTYASDKASLATSANLFDTAPNSIIWLGDLG